MKMEQLHLTLNNLEIVQNIQPAIDPISQLLIQGGPGMSQTGGGGTLGK